MQLDVSYLDQVLVLLVFAVSLNLLLGYAGIFSAATGAFGAIGGYSLVWLTSAHGLSFIPAALMGVAAAGGFGLVVGYAALRLEMVWLLLLTLAFQPVAVGLLSLGLQAPPKTLSLFGHGFVEPTQVLPLLAVCSVVLFVLCYRIGESPFGRVLRGIRDDEVAARSLGKNTSFYRLSVFTITAAIAGAGGALLTTSTTLASPTLFGFDLSIEIVAMVMIGGIGNMIGTIVGVTLVVLSTPFFENVIHLSTTVTSFAQQVAYGLVLVVVLAFRPQGILPAGVSFAWLWRRGAGGLPEQTDGQPFSGDLRLHGPRARIEVVQRRPNAEGPLGGYGDAVMKVRDISKSFGGIRAVNGLTMELRRGIITALIGPNGAGKTTVFNLLTGALPVDGGRVYLGDTHITGLRPDEITRLGMARSFQDVRVFPSLTVLDNVVYGIPDQPGTALRNTLARPRLTARGEREARAKAYEWLRFIEMGDLAQVRCGSLGFAQQKLVALARILATDADVLLLDEPGSGVDHVWIDKMVGVIEQLREAGRTICIVEHSLEVVGRLADHVYFMELGRVTAEGSFEELTNDPRLTEAYFGTT